MTICNTSKKLFEWYTEQRKECNSIILRNNIKSIPNKFSNIKGDIGSFWSLYNLLNEIDKDRSCLYNLTYKTKTDKVEGYQRK